MTESKLQVRLPLLLAATLAVGMFIGQLLPHHDRDIRFFPSSSAGPVSGALDEIMRYIQEKYVDTVDVTALKTGAIDHLLEQLDPHSVYITPDEVQAVEDDMNGGFEGVGIEFIMVDDTIQVVMPLVGGPSEAAGILPGDRLVRIGDSVVAGVKVDNGKIYRLLRDKKGTQVRLGIIRGQEKVEREFLVTRDVIAMHSVDVAYMLDDRTGYIKVNRFSANTQEEFMENLRKLVEEQGLQHLVLDLRGNPGGYLQGATEMLSQFFPDGKLLVYTKGRTDEPKEYKSNGRARFNIQNVVVLIDENSASASEIVAGAIQDWDRGWVIGRRSFGKGLVQEQYDLHDGGALRLTIARYYTPSGRSIQRDYKHDPDYNRESERRLKNGELSDPARIKLADTTKYYTGQSRIVFGGGGITPDVFIPIDTSFANPYFQKVRGFIPQYVARWMEHRDRATLPAGLDDFVRSFIVSDALLEELVAYGEKQGVPRVPAQLAPSRAELKLQLKARLAKVLFKEVGMYRVLNDDDPAVEKALQVARSGEPVAKK